MAIFLTENSIRRLNLRKNLKEVGKSLSRYLGGVGSRNSCAEEKLEPSLLLNMSDAFSKYKGGYCEVWHGKQGGKVNKQ